MTIKWISVEAILFKWIDEEYSKIWKNFKFWRKRTNDKKLSNSKKFNGHDYEQEQPTMIFKCWSIGLG